MRIATFGTRCMGSPLRLTVVGANPRQARAARDAAWGEMRASDAELSRFRADSELSRINRLAGSGTPFTPSHRLRCLLVTAARAQRMTGGRFDPRIITALEAIGERAGVPLPPAAPSVATAGQEPWLRRDPADGTFRISVPVDSGGLGKGLGLRWALKAARRAAPDAAGLLLEAGGDVAACGTGPARRPWSIGVEDPSARERLVATLGLPAGAVATSSVAVRTWEHEGRRVHHLIDPASGRPAETGLLAVSVHAPDPAWAEVLSKALFLAGRAGIAAEARRGDLAAWWVEEDGSFHASPAGRLLTTWNRLEGRVA
jgi:thiamine biosynthesis lipoprotein